MRGAWRLLCRHCPTPCAPPLLQADISPGDDRPFGVGGGGSPAASLGHTQPQPPKESSRLPSIKQSMRNANTWGMQYGEEMQTVHWLSHAADNPEVAEVSCPVSCKLMHPLALLYAAFLTS